MSATVIPTGPEDLDTLAGEYVLGVLEAREAAAVARALPVNAVLRDAVERWETRLAPLVLLAEPAEPGPDLWPRIEASLAARGSAEVVRPRFPIAPSGNRVWKGWTAASTAVAASLALFLLTRPPAPTPGLMTVLLTSRDQPAWLVQAEGDSLRLASLNPRPVEPGRVTQLWALPQGATAPVSSASSRRKGGSP
ncbi:hypothetical protein ACE7GA_15045 [Roseomonas sp. CCTCC AB2023176]|uniref:hypothetical protein n=1 Tax=Roseomonas sp. CCTCC AB2023176 TaxID=3342640 RepID=UPI0035DD81CA